MADRHSADAASEWPSTPIKSSGYDKGEPQQQHHFDELSTAAPSALQSPAAGFARLPPKAPLDVLDLGPALAGLEVGEASPERMLTLQLQRRLEWYFSPEHLRVDTYLRSRMDRFGWVALPDVLHLSGIRALEASSAAVLSAINQSSMLQASGDFRRLRARNPAVWAAFAPRPTEEPWSSLSASPASSPPCCRDPTLAPPREPEVEVADEDLTIAASVEPPRSATAASMWTEWAKGAGGAAATGEAARRRRRARRHGRRNLGAPAMEYLVGDSDDTGAWLRFEDGGYAAPAGSLLWW